MDIQNTNINEQITNDDKVCKDAIVGGLTLVQGSPGLSLRSKVETISRYIKSAESDLSTICASPCPPLSSFSKSNLENLYM